MSRPNESITAAAAQGLVYNGLDLVSAFLGVPELPARDARTADAFAVVPIPEFPAHRLGRDATGAPCVLLAVRASPGEAVALSVTLAHLSVRHDVQCRLTSGSKTEEHRMTVVRLLGGERELREPFLRVLGPIVAQLGDTPDANSVTRALHHLVDLFRALDRPPRKSVQGLWAEVFLLARASDPRQALRAWHATPGDRHDFVDGAERVEVKSAARGPRRHHFSLEQLTVPPGTSLLIASVHVEPAGAGTSLAELLAEVRVQVATDATLAAKADAVAISTLGSLLAPALEMRFDREFAEATLAWYDGTEVPRVPSPIPSEVTDVRFSADLSAVTPLGGSMVRSRGPLANALA